MARIRTIKPEFWTDEKIVQLPYQARLMFIGMWNFADDYGLLYDEPERIRLQVLPGDDIDSVDLVDLLVAADLIERYATPDDRRFLAIKRFSEHQKVDHPSKSKIPREGSRKLAIPQASRRALAMKYGCEPGETKDVACDYCGAPGAIHWWRLYSGRPSAWVTFTLEIDHFDPEAAGGDGNPANLVLACRPCNRSKQDRGAGEYLARAREGSARVAPDQGRDQGKEKYRGANAPVAQARPVSVDTRKVFEAWQASTGKPRARLDDKRQRAIQRALKAYPLDEVLDAVTGWRNDPWPERPRHNDVTVLLRDAEHIEKFRDLSRAGPPPTLPGRGRPNAFDHLRRRHAEAQAREQHG